MRFTAIDTSAWEELKKSIEELALCVREQFGTKPELPDLLHNGDVCRILNISKRTLPHYRDTSVLPFIPIGQDRKCTRLNSRHAHISCAVFCLHKDTPTASWAPAPHPWL